MKTLHNMIRLSGRWSTFVYVLAFMAIVDHVQAQNVTIYGWSLPGSIRSEDVRIRHTSTVLSDYFDTGIPEAISVLKSENAIYVRFHNNSTTIISDGDVTVTAEYAEADPGLAPEDLASIAAAITSWRTIGSYVMDLEILPSDPPGFGLLPGATYPTSREVSMPSRYQVLCSIDCDDPLPTSSFLRVSLSLSGDTDPSDNFALSYYDLTEGAPTADVVILHDVSGSMAGELPWAQERANMFVDLMNKGDRVGVVAFSTQFPGDAQTVASVYPITTIDPSDISKTNARDGINSLTAYGRTPMGSGIIEARDQLNAVPGPYPPNRAIVMLTDGKENEDPRVKDPPDYPILDSLNTDSKGPIALYPLWFGTMSHWGKDLLDDIILYVDEGKVVDQPDDDLALAEAYLMIRGILTSDDVYDIYRGITGDSYQGAVYVDNVTDELILTAAWHTFERDLDISILPPGTTSWQSAGSLATSTSSGQLYVIHRFVNPQAGQWKYRLSQTDEGEEYVLASLADKVEILMQSFLAVPAFSAGETMMIKTKLSFNGKPVRDATVQATVEVPQRSLGTILHKYRDRLKTPWPVDPSSEKTRAAGIIEELKKFLGSDQIFTYEPKTVVLKDANGDGTYEGNFRETYVAGTYRVTITAEGVSGTRGETFRREHHHAAVVSLGEIDPERSVIDIALQDYVGKDGAEIWRVTTIPVDTHGNFADPGYAGHIQVQATAGMWLRKLDDNEDGSYTRFLQLKADEPAQIIITAFGKTLPKQNVREKKPGNWQMSLHSGIVQPTGSFDDVVNRGSSFTFDLGYRFHPHFSVLFLFGTHEFPLEVGSSETVLQLSANLRVLFASRGISPYFQAGPGLYRIFDNREVGLNVGAGLVYPASHRIDVEGGLDFHNIFTDDKSTQFWQAHIGFSIRL